MNALKEQLTGIWPVRLVFLVEGTIFGAWLPRIPDIKNALQLEAGQLGLALAGFPAGSLIGFLVAARFAHALGLRRACMIAGPVFALTFVFVGAAGSLLTFFIALSFCGIAVALMEVAMSSKAGQIENLMGRRIMSQCHGFWSIGSVIGALVGGFLSQAAVTPGTQFILLNPLLAGTAVVVAANMPNDPAITNDESAGFFVLPTKALWLLCLMPVGIMALEGAVMDWSALFVREVLAGEPFVAAAAYAVFSTMMAVLRLSGDRLAERFGSFTVVLVSSISAALGVAVFALAPSLQILLVGAALMGAGVAPVFPLAVSAAAASPGKSAEANVAAVSFIAFVVFLLSPPLMGGLAELLDLRKAFLFMVPLALGSTALSVALRYTDLRIDRGVIGPKTSM
jgi:MFS family permease